MITFFENIDRYILFAINGCHNEFFDSLMWMVSSKWFGIPFYILLLFLSYKQFGAKITLLFLIGGLASVGLADLSSKYLFKEIFLRYRPSQNLEIQNQLHYVNNYHGGTYGFVSSHAANMFAITFFAFLSLKNNHSNLIYLLFIFPVLVSISRIYLGVHYPSDVLVGGLLGCFIGYLIYRILAKEFKTNQE